ncbi:hypothetical protein FB451DRAFT_1561886 [Mycena latifolia]|nr:hypothetical protein FB451DRAFT_1561886 [Mycena latifolia]
MSTDHIQLLDSGDTDALSAFIFQLPTSSSSYREFYRVSELLVSRLTASAPSTDDPLVLSWSVLADLPRDRLELYRGALTRLATQPTDAEAAADLPERSTDILKFLDAASPWAPLTKSDDMAIRSLDLLVQTPEAMRPFVPALLEWLQDCNWPPWGGCRAQLARFPEVAIDPIRDILRKGDDGEWEGHLLSFLVDCMPGQVRERARAEVERIAQRPTQSKIDNDAVETAEECLKEMDHWVDRARILPKKISHPTLQS